MARKGFFTLMALLLLSLILATPVLAEKGIDEKNKVIKVAVVGPLTGEMAVYGVDQKKGAEAAIKKFNEAGGFKKGKYAGYKLEAAYFDDKADPKESANIAQQVVIGDLFAEVGPTNSSPASSSAPIYDRANMPMILVYASDTRLTHSGYKNVFRIVVTTDTEAESYARHASQTLKAKKVVEIWENTAYGQALHNSYVKNIKASGGTLLATESIDAAKDVDFKAILTKMKELKPDLLQLNVTYTPGGLIVNQARGMGFDVPMLSAIGCNNPKFREMMPEKPGVVYLSPTFNQLSSEKEVVDFIKFYKELFKADPSESAALAYDGINSLIAAVEAGAVKREELKTFLRKVDFPGVTNRIRFDEFGDVSQPSLPLWILDETKNWKTYK
ncbi:MAG: branched-chain amino acid ABC transporter substrate-binding protein [Deltaproteobacteria bacterium]|nr:branched-chain amino acid ABC transporter substrate-binding protein [Deltaproteobacteria bacterium]